MPVCTLVDYMYMYIYMYILVSVVLCTFSLLQTFSTVAMVL